MVKTHTYKTARGNTFQHVNSKLTTRDASGVVGEYNFTLNVTGDALAHIQVKNPEVINKIALREYFNALCGFSAPVVSVAPVVEILAVPVPAVADTSVLEIPAVVKTLDEKFVSFVGGCLKAGHSIEATRKLLLANGVKSDELDFYLPL